MNKEKITTLVLPVAGRGVRLQPLTNNTPKALVLLAGRPILSYFLEEAVASGIKDVVLITSPGFRDQFETYIKEAKNEFPNIQLHIYEQTDPWGHGRAVLLAYELLRDKPFIIRFPDDLIVAEKPIVQSLSELFDDHQLPVILLQEVPLEKASSYGVVGIGGVVAPGLHRITHYIEKPQNPPSNLTVVGGYVFTPKLLEYLKEAEVSAPKVADGLLINEAFYKELAQGGEILGWQFSGHRFDCGSLQGFYEAEAFLKEKRN